MGLFYLGAAPCWPMCPATCADTTCPCSSQKTCLCLEFWSSCAPMCCIPECDPGRWMASWHEGWEECPSCARGSHGPRASSSSLLSLPVWRPKLEVGLLFSAVRIHDWLRSCLLPPCAALRNSPCLTAVPQDNCACAVLKAVCPETPKQKNHITGRTGWAWVGTPLLQPRRPQLHQWLREGFVSPCFQDFFYLLSYWIRGKNKFLYYLKGSTQFAGLKFLFFFLPFRHIQTNVCFKKRTGC